MFRFIAILALALIALPIAQAPAEAHGRRNNVAIINVNTTPPVVVQNLNTGIGGAFLSIQSQPNLNFLLVPGFSASTTVVGVNSLGQRVIVNQFGQTVIVR